MGDSFGSPLRRFLVTRQSDSILDGPAVAFDLGKKFEELRSISGRISPHAGTHSVPQSPKNGQAVSQLLAGPSVEAKSSSQREEVDSPNTLYLGLQRVEVPVCNSAGPFLYDSRNASDCSPLHAAAEIRKSTGLSKLGATQVVAALGRFAKKITTNQQTLLYHDKHSFKRVMDELGIAPADSLFASLASGATIPLREVSTKAALLCGGSEAEKVEAIFGLVDQNHDGYLSMEELSDFFLLIFENILTKTLIAVYSANGLGTNPAAFAAQTASECMRMCDLNRDGQLSLEEFTKWFANPRMNPVYSPFAKPAVQSTDAISLDEI